MLATALQNPAYRPSDRLPLTEWSPTGLTCHACGGGCLYLTISVWFVMWSLQTKISEIKYANHFLSWLTFFHDQLLDYWNEAFNQLHLDNIDYQHFVAIAGWRTGMSGTAPRSFHGHWPGVAKSGGWHSLAQKKWHRSAYSYILAWSAVLMEPTKPNRHHLLGCSQSVESRLLFWSFHKRNWMAHRKYIWM